MFGFVKEVFIGLLSICTIQGFCEPIAFDPKGPIKFISNLMSRVNETRFLVQHESCECKC